CADVGGDPRAAVTKDPASAEGRRRVVAGTDTPSVGDIGILLPVSHDGAIDERGRGVLDAIDAGVRVGVDRAGSEGWRANAPAKKAMLLALCDDTVAKAWRSVKAGDSAHIQGEEAAKDLGRGTGIARYRAAFRLLDDQAVKSRAF